MFDSFELKKRKKYTSKIYFSKYEISFLFSLVKCKRLIGQSCTHFSQNCKILEAGRHQSLFWENIQSSAVSKTHPESPCLSCTRSPALGTATQMCLSTAEQRGRISSLATLAAHWLMQPRRLLAFFAAGMCFRLPVNFVSTRSLSARQEAFPPPEWNFALPSAGLPEVPAGSVLQPIKVPLTGSTSVWCHQPPLPPLYHLQTCGGSTWPHYPDHW